MNVDYKQIEKYENYFIAIICTVFAVLIFFGTTLTWNGVVQPQWLAGIVGVTFMSAMFGVAFGAAWVLNWLINAGWRK